MRFSASSWFTSVVAAACVAAASPAVVPAAAHADVQAPPAALTAEADLLAAWDSLAFPEVALDDAVGDAAGIFYGLEWFFSDVLYAFNSIVSLVLTPVSWIPFVGPWAASLIWTPISFVESILWQLLVGGVYYPYYPYYAEATDPGLAAELAEVAAADFGGPEPALNVDALGLVIDVLEADVSVLGFDLDAFGVDPDPLGVEGSAPGDGVSDLGEAIQEVSETLLSLLG